MAVYVASLYAAMVDSPRLERLTLYGAAGDLGPLAGLSGHPKVRFEERPEWLSPRARSVAWHQLGWPVELARSKFDVVHFPAANRRVAAIGGLPVVATVHDLAELVLPERYSRARAAYVRLWVLPMMCTVDRVIAVSEATGAHLSQALGRRCPPVDVVHNGVDLARFGAAPAVGEREKVAARLGFQEPFAIYPARLEHPVKNHTTLIRAFVRAKKEYGLPHRLVLAGAPWNGADAVLDMVRAHADAVVHLGFVSAGELPELVRQASAMVFPSRFEGFGLPVLEAMACGTPVVASRCTSLPEVVGCAGELVGPDDLDGWVHALAKVLRDEATAGRLRARGIERASRFTWDRAASATLDSFESAVARRKRP